MKKIIFLIVVLFFGAKSVEAQNANANANALANKIAKKLQDSLNLSSEQKNKIKDINLDLHNQKMAARGQTTNRDSLGRSLQAIEYGRDSLYRKVLTVGQYGQYKQKKKNLVSAN